MKCIVKILTATAVDDSVFDISYNASITPAQVGGNLREFSSNARIALSASAAQMTTNIKNAVIQNALGNGITVVSGDILVIDTL